MAIKCAPRSRRESGNKDPRTSLSTLTDLPKPTRPNVLHQKLPEPTRPVLPDRKLPEPGTSRTMRLIQQEIQPKSGILFPAPNRTPETSEEKGKFPGYPGIFSNIFFQKTLCLKISDIESNFHFFL